MEGTTKQRLLEAAEELFADGGFESVSVREITALAGANVAAVNYYFGDKKRLYAAIFDTVFDWFWVTQMWVPSNANPDGYEPTGSTAIRVARVARYVQP